LQPVAQRIELDKVLEHTNDVIADAPRFCSDDFGDCVLVDDVNVNVEDLSFLIIEIRRLIGLGPACLAGGGEELRATCE